VLNGFLEEYAWRGAFLGSFADRPRFGFVAGWLLFSAWHIPLTFAVGVTNEGGGAALVGGAAGLGLLWSFVAWRVRAIGWTVAAHVLTNFLAFSNLILANGWL
jgi:membrane protease YdiL (CAAX protease family)